MVNPSSSATTTRSGSSNASSSSDVTSVTNSSSTASFRYCRSTSPLTSSNAFVLLGANSFNLMRCKPNSVSTTSLISPTSVSANAASSKLGTNRPRVATPRSPPCAALPGSSDDACATSSKGFPAPNSVLIDSSKTLASSMVRFSVDTKI